MHIYGEDWPLLVVETLSPIPGMVRYMLVVMSTSDINASMCYTTHCTCLCVILRHL